MCNFVCSSLVLVDRVLFREHLISTWATRMVAMTDAAINSIVNFEAVELCPTDLQPSGLNPCVAGDASNSHL